MKNIFEEQTPLLTNLFNKDFLLEISPREFILAIIKQILKKRNRLLIENNKPVSLMAAITKNFKKILETRLTSFLEKYGEISQKHFEFRKGKSLI